MTMRRVDASFLLFVVLLALGFYQLTRGQSVPERTPLDEYIAAPDDVYRWRIVREASARGAEILVIDMVSQSWRTREDVDRPVWQHWLTMVVPEQPKSTTGMLLIGGGRNGKDPPEGASEIIQSVAKATGTVVAELHMVPNQPLVFHDDGERRTEDDLIAYTWDQFLKTEDPTWPARNPMVKSAVRAMDTITAVTADQYGEATSVDKFVVAGGSKRGWTTWLTGAVDERVAAIIPIVIDVLNVDASMRHHFAVYGFWAPAVGDYVEHRIPQRRNHPALQKLFKLVDPYYYRHRLTMPKFIVNASGDQFFPPDSSQFYFAELRGPKHLRYVPNANHSLDGTDALESVIAYYSLILAGQQAPRFSWTHGREGMLEVTTIDPPKEVRLWHATNPKARDFRLETFGPKFESEVLEDQGEGRYIATVSVPEEGWTAYFAELTYEVLGSLPLKLTTDIRVVPDARPYEDKDSTLPTTITLLCIAPDAQTAKRIEQATRSQEIPNVDGEMRFSFYPVHNPSEAMQLHLNWTPEGRFEKSAEAITGWLREQGCHDFEYRLESGRPDAEAG